MTRSVQEMFSLIANSVKSAVQDMKILLENNPFSEEQRAALEGVRVRLSTAALRLEELLTEEANP